jgi:hypothetical protein
MELLNHALGEKLKNFDFAKVLPCPKSFLVRLIYYGDQRRHH